MKELSRDILITVDGASGATTPLNGTVVDMDGWENVLFIAFATATNAGQFLHMELGTDSATMEDATGDVTHTANALYYDAIRPPRRFVRGVLTASGASSPFRVLVTIQYGARAKPSTMPAGTTGGRFYSNDRGTATGLATG